MSLSLGIGRDERRNDVMDGWTGVKVFISLGVGTDERCNGVMDG